MEYLAAIRLRVLIAQEAKIEQAKVQEVTLKKAIDELAVGSNEIDNQSENAHRTLIKAGEIPPPARVPVFCITPAAKPIKGKIHQGPQSTLSSAITWLLLFG